MADTLTRKRAEHAPAAVPARGGERRGPPGEPRRVGYLYLLPALVIYGLFLLFPLGRSLWLSFYEWDGLTLGHWVGLANYGAVFTDPELRGAFLHAIVLIFFYAVLPVTLGLVLAATMSRARLRGLSFFRTVLFLPQVVAMVAVGVAWRQIYGLSGPLNDLLRAVGLDAVARAWLGDYTFALPAIGFVGTWIETGLALVLFLGGIGKIPRELYDAARVDGAGPVREFFAVTLPSLRGEIAVALTLTVIAALRTFDLVYVMTRGGPGNSTTVPSYTVYHRAFEIGQVGSAAALAMVLTALIFALTVGITRVAERGRS